MSYPLRHDLARDAERGVGIVDLGSRGVLEDRLEPHAELPDRIPLPVGVGLARQADSGDCIDVPQRMAVVVLSLRVGVRNVEVACAVVDEDKPVLVDVESGLRGARVIGVLDQLVDEVRLVGVLVDNALLHAAQIGPVQGVRIL